MKAIKYINTEHFNSPLGIWLLTVIFVSFSPFLYDTYQACRAEKLEVRQLDYEIKSRLSSLATNWNHHSSDIPHFLEALKYLSRPSQAPYPIHTYTEYEHSTLLSLLWQQYVLVPDDEKPEIKKAINAAEQLMVIYYAQLDLYKKVENAQSSKGLDLKIKKLQKQDEQGSDIQLRLMDMLQDDIPDLVTVFANQKLSNHDLALIKELNLKRWDVPFK